MLANLRVKSGKYKVKEVDRDQNGVVVKMLENSPFAKQGETQFVSPNMLEPLE